MKNSKLLVKIALATVFLSVAFLSAFSQNQSNENGIVSIIGTGDIMLGSNYPATSKLPPNDGKDLFRNTKDILRDADVTFGNLEGCFLNEGGNVKSCKSGCYFFRMPDRYVNHLVDAGYDVMNIANNHMGDFGAAGRSNTVKVLKEAGLNYAGLEGCETSIFEINGVKYGFCGFAPNSGTIKITNIPLAKKIVSELDAQCDIVIVSFHGGAEGKQHNRVTKKAETFYGENRGNVYEFAHAVIDAGADVVFGHGPHVVRAAELYKDRFIIYSMGNFCTSGEVNINGVSGYAPIVKVFTDKKGKFVRGQIFSFLQKNKSGPIEDSNQLAAKEIKRLTELDFPQTNLSISSEGAIERKEAHTLNLSHPQKENSLLPKTKIKMEFADFQNNTDSISPFQSIIDFSKQFIGSPYRRGSKGPNNFDCSGFTSFIFKNFGYKLSPSCVTQVKQGVKIEVEELTTGDLIFFKGRNAQSNRAGHVGIVISNDDTGNVTFIHACQRGVKIEELNKSTYYKPRYLTGLRVLAKNS